MKRLTLIFVFSIQLCAMAFAEEKGSYPCTGINDPTALSKCEDEFIAQSVLHLDEDYLSAAKIAIVQALNPVTTAKDVRQQACLRAKIYISKISTNTKVSADEIAKVNDDIANCELNKD